MSLPQSFLSDRVSRGLVTTYPDCVSPGVRCPATALLWHPWSQTHAQSWPRPARLPDGTRSVSARATQTRGIAEQM
eukprot:3714678-Rhodomonas_salina.1